MTDIGRRPTLEDIIRILDACTVSSATDIASDNGIWQFHLTFDAKKMYGPVEGWSDGLPKPTWLIEEVLTQLRAWRTQCNKEQQWVSKEENFGASIDSLMAHWTEELKKADRVVPQTMQSRMAVRTLSNTILRLQELKERREAGAVYSSTESRREKARKAWMEDETEAPKREEAQRRQRRTGDYEFYHQATEEEISKAWKEFWGHFEDGAFYDGRYADPGRQRKQNPQPGVAGKTPWYEVLGVAPNASKKEIKQAIRRMRSKYHPDKPENRNAQSEAMIRLVNEVAEIALAGL